MSINLTPTASKIVNDALVHSGQEATFDVKLKSLLILIVEAALRKGYVDGWEDCEKDITSQKVTRSQLIDFAELFKKAKEPKDVRGKITWLTVEKRK